MERAMTTAPCLGRALVIALALSSAGAGCAPKDVGEAEARKDVAWLTSAGTSDAMAALGRLADSDPKAQQALESRAATDVNVYIAAWQAVTRGQAWGDRLVRAGLSDPMRAELAASVLPRKDAKLVPYVGELEGAVVRLAAGRRGSVVAGVLASVGPPSHAAVERRLLDAKTRGAMCDGIGLPEASPDARGLLLKVPADARDQPSCVGVALAMASRDDVTLDWMARSAEPGLFGAAARGDMPCPRLVTAWKNALASRPAAEQVGLVVPLKLGMNRCGKALDPVLAELLATTPGARASIALAIDPFGSEVADLKETCAMLAKSWMSAEAPRVRERAADAVANGCRNAR
jgi:hypothetical protein